MRVAEILVPAENSIRIYVEGHTPSETLSNRPAAYTLSFEGKAKHRMTNAIEVRSLVKRFGDITAVDHLDLDIPRGQLTSLLGPNGAGKTTTVRILATLLPPCEGETDIGGFRLTEQNDRIKPLLGLVPQEIALYETLSARQNLRFFAQLCGYRGAAMDERVMKLLADVQLDDRADDAIENFSGGMQRRVNIAVALIHDPDILFIDEPTVGIDSTDRRGNRVSIND